MPAPASAAEISVSSLRLLLVDRRHTFPAAVEGRQKSNASRVQVALTSGVWSSKRRLHFVGSLTPSIPGVEYLLVRTCRCLSEVSATLRSSPHMHVIWLVALR